MGGFFKPGDRRTLATQFTGGKGLRPQGTLSCWDTAGRFHVFDFNGAESKVWKRPRWWRPKPPSSPEKAFAELHPAVDLGKLTKVEGHASKQMDDYR